MEDMARLALVEESVRDIDKFRKILYELLRFLNVILENPHDYQHRTIKSNLLKEVAKFESVSEYLKYIGFQLGENDMIYPSNSTLSNLRMAQVAIQRKINFCFGSLEKSQVVMKGGEHQAISQNNLSRVNVLNTTNPFLLKIQELFNGMLKYEDLELLALAREQIPIVTLQLMALDRVREQQLQLKTGKIKGTDLPFDIALLMELMYWFKEKFFKWVDNPDCEVCGGATTFAGSSSMTTASETCRVEVYKCSTCPGVTRFPRYNDLRTLLRTRRGRCGEWAAAFTLLCRALGYDTRYVYDTTDHVWCEVFNYDTNTWLHVDPCEDKLDTPLMYTHGWGKKLSYVIAFSKDDLQDVTWRYTYNHKEVLARRTNCSEKELINAILSLRAARYNEVTELRRKYLTRRTALELVALMVERKPSELESGGRVSGAPTWRRERGEAHDTPHIFRLCRAARYCIRYHSAADTYKITQDGKQMDDIKCWAAGVHAQSDLFRKVEKDWRKVYLARQEGVESGSVSWKLECNDGLICTELSVKAISVVYESGCIQWKVSFDGHSPQLTSFGECPTHFKQPFQSVTLTAELSGGERDVAWQHAQLFRTSLDIDEPSLELVVRVQQNHNIA